jgi:hypothetical protein
MLKYGNDKPDLRNPIEIVDVTEAFRDSDFAIFARAIKGGAVVRCIPAPASATRPRSFFDKLNDWARQEGAAGLGYIIFDNGEAKAGVGGGICQLANLLHWMVLHTPLVVTERSEHSFDPFPDDGRVLPWGVGCTIYYNYVDFRFRNEGPATYQLRVSVGDHHLCGEIRSDRPQPHAYKVFAVDEEFVPYRGQWYRMNEIWRNVIDRRTGDQVRKELIKKNCALVKYLPPGVAGTTRRPAGLGEAEVVQ